MEKKKNIDIDKVASELREIVDSFESPEGPVLLLIAGPTCSGKTFLSEELMERWKNVSLIPLDAYFRDIDDPNFPKDEAEKISFDIPGSYLEEEFNRDLGLLLSGKNIRLPKYDIARNKRSSEKGIVVESHPIVIAEGLFVIDLLERTHPQTLKIYLDIDLSICLKRRIERDTKMLNVSAEMVVKLFYERITPEYLKHVLPQKKNADIIIRG